MTEIIFQGIFYTIIGLIIIFSVYQFIQGNRNNIINNLHKQVDNTEIISTSLDQIILDNFPTHFSSYLIREFNAMFVLETDNIRDTTNLCYYASHKVNADVIKLTININHSDIDLDILKDTLDDIVSGIYNFKIYNGIK